MSLSRGPHQHDVDRLDRLGRRPGSVPSPAGAARLGGNATGLEPWAATEIHAPGGPTVTVTAVPAQHGPPDSESVVGPVTGFTLSAETVIALHFSDWTHFTQGADQLRAAFAGHGITPRLRIPVPGEALTV